jgi:hypothetical protein
MWVHGLSVPLGMPDLGVAVRPGQAARSANSEKIHRETYTFRTSPY